MVRERKYQYVCSSRCVRDYMLYSLLSRKEGCLRFTKLDSTRDPENTAKYLSGDQ